ncbi:MAG: PD-(D/E)XK motif protein [Candidatus Methanoperedens sp.]|nr:PD-(D/E)XK motif protein [Candidatus Methanoperedens sp.]
MTILEDVWKSLEDDSKYETGICILKRRLEPSSSCDVFLGYEKPVNRRMLLLRISCSNTPETEALPRSKGFEVMAVSLPEDDEDHATLELILTDSRFTDIFTNLVQDVVDNITAQKNEMLMIKAFIERLVKWQQFLDRYSHEGLGDEAQRGLYGELWFLRKYLIPILRINKALDAWKGPARKAQDFQFSDCAVEVKTTISKQHQKMYIANEQQLDDTGLASLFLQHISLMESSGGGETLVDIVEDIRKTIADEPAASQKMEDSLFEAGYLNAQAHRYNKTGYNVRSSNIFRISEGFPRITEGDLLNGVGDVHYSVNVSECMHYVINECDFESFLVETMNGY